MTATESGQNPEPESQAPKPEPTYTAEDYQLYLEERKTLVQAAQESAKSFDKAVLTLAAGAFGFSVLVLKDVFPHRDPASTSHLLVSWVLFAVSIVTILASFLTSQWACKRQIEVTRAALLKDEEYRNWWSYTTNGLNIVSIVSLACPPRMTAMPATATR